MEIYIRYKMNKFVKNLKMNNFEKKLKMNNFEEFFLLKFVFKIH